MTHDEALRLMTGFTETLHGLIAEAIPAWLEAAERGVRDLPYPGCHDSLARQLVGQVIQKIYLSYFAELARLRPYLTPPTLERITRCPNEN